jgi:hypothetical protein
MALGGWASSSLKQHWNWALNTASVRAEHCVWQQLRPHRQGAEREMRDHLLVGEFITVCRLDDAIKHQDAAEGLRLQQRDILCSNVMQHQDYLI